MKMTLFKIRRTLQNKKISNLFILFSIILSVKSHAIPQFDDIKIEVKSTSKNDFQVKLSPPDKHHFNQEAPTFVKKIKNLSKNIEKNSDAEILKFSKTLSSVSFNTSFEDCLIEMAVFLCDDQNTYCVPLKKNISCEDLKKKSKNNSAQITSKSLERSSSIDTPNLDQKNLVKESRTELGTPSNAQINAENRLPSSPVDTFSSSSISHSLFIKNNPELAIEKARKEHKPLLIDFFGIWCPPCNVLDETVFNQNEFKEIAKNFVLLKLDADSETSWNLKSKFHVKGYPTVVFSTFNNEEIFKFSGSLPPSLFYKKMHLALKYKSTSASQLEKLVFGQKNSLLAWNLIDIFVSQQEYEKALNLLPLATKINSNFSERQKDLLTYLPAKVALSNLLNEEKIEKSALPFIEFLKSSVENYPLEETFLEKLVTLESFIDDKKDFSEKFLQDLNQWIQKEKLLVTHLWLNKKGIDKKRLDKKNYKNNDSELTLSDLWFLRAEAFEKLNLKTESQFAYQKAAEILERKMKENNLDLEKNRGYNLDRIYAIHKSGDQQRALKLYQQLLTVYPEEFTFHFGEAQLLKDMGKPKEALVAAKNAIQYSYGDNKLRAVYLMGDLLISMKESQEARSLLDETLKNTTLPDDKSLRTHRYYKKLVDLRSKITVVN